DGWMVELRGERVDLVGDRGVVRLHARREARRMKAEREPPVATHDDEPSSPARSRLDGAVPVGLDAELVRPDREPARAGDEYDRDAVEARRAGAQPHGRLRGRQAADGDAGNADALRELAGAAGEDEADHERSRDDGARGRDEGHLPRTSSDVPRPDARL